MKMVGVIYSCNVDRFILNAVHSPFDALHRNSCITREQQQQQLQQKKTEKSNEYSMRYYVIDAIC